MVVCTEIFASFSKRCKKQEGEGGFSCAAGSLGCIIGVLRVLLIGCHCGTQVVLLWVNINTQKWEREEAGPEKRVAW